MIVGERFQAAENLNNWNENHPKKILVISGVCFIITIIGLFKMDYDSTIMDDLKPGNKLYDDMKFVEKHFGGTLPLEVVLDFKFENSSLNYQNLVKVDEFKTKLGNIDEIGSIISYTDYLKIKSRIKTT